jgi:ferredoxin
MKIVVDLTRCQGYAQCAFAAPDVFAIQGDEALLYDADPDDTQREKIARAAAACPVQPPHTDPARRGWRLWRHPRRTRDACRPPRRADRHGRRVLRSALKGDS